MITSTHNTFDSVQGVRARGFTLAELMVAIAAILLLTIGIGQLFSNVGKLVSTGAAVSEVDQLARAIEQQLRDDFAAMSRMKTDETLLAIRSRTLGDVDHNGLFDGFNNGEAPLYLTLEDLEADEEEGFTANPYQDIDGDGIQDGRGVTVRLDEVLFIGFGGDQDAFVSAQEAGSNGTMVTAPVARVYYGHGLKPRRVGIDYDDTDPNSTTYLGRPDNPVINEWLPDGDFGQPLSDPTGSSGNLNRFDTSLNVRGRNEFAGEFVLTRQPLLLKGGLAVGYPTVANRMTPIGQEREVAILARDSDNRDVDIAGSTLSPGQPFIRPNNDPNLSTATSLSTGRTDICAQSPESLKRWLEGLLIDSTPGAVQPDATALDAGFFDIQGATFPDRELWERDSTGDALALKNNLAGLQSAIAGMFGRMLVEADPPVVNRKSDATTPSDPGGMDPEDTLMDLHATLASRCSNFEVAWSDGTLWLDTNKDLGVDFKEAVLAARLSSPPSSDADIIYKAGDIIWFDADLPRAILAQEFPVFYPPTGVIDPEILPDERRTRLFVKKGTDNNPSGNVNSAEYNVDITGGVEMGFDTEYLAIWGYRKPGPDGTYTGEWAKPQMLRFRMTLHDSRFRIKSGKTFEFIVSIDTQ